MKSLSVSLDMDERNFRGRDFVIAAKRVVLFSSQAEVFPLRFPCTDENVVKTTPVHKDPRND